MYLSLLRFSGFRSKEVSTLWDCLLVMGNACCAYCSYSHINRRTQYENPVLKKKPIHAGNVAYIRRFLFCICILIYKLHTIWNFQQNPGHHLHHTLNASLHCLTEFNVSFLFFPNTVVSATFISSDLWPKHPDLNLLNHVTWGETEHKLQFVDAVTWLWAMHLW